MYEDNNMFWDNDAQGFFDGAVNTVGTTVKVVDELGHFIARVERWEIRRVLLKHFGLVGSGRGTRRENRKKRELLRQIDNLQAAVINQQVDRQIALEYRLGVKVLTSSRGEMYL